MMMLKDLRNQIDHDAIKDLKSVQDPVMVYVGSWDGRLALEYMQRVPGLTMHAIEPDPKSIRKTLMHLKPYQRAFCHPLAISDHNGVERLMSSSGNVSNSLYKKALERKKKRIDGIDVSCETMSDFFERYELDRVDLLKINCVGGEYRFFGEDEIFLDHCETIMIEVHCILPFDNEEFQVERDNIYSRLRESGFELELGITHGAGIKFYSQYWKRI